jgi:carboxyl-terminal processing protease
MIAVAACAGPAAPAMSPHRGAAAPAVGFAELGAAVVEHVRTSFFDPARGAAWAERHAGYARQITERAAFVAETNRLLAELGASHTELIDAGDPRAAELRAIFGHELGSRPRMSLGLQVEPDEAGLVIVTAYPDGPAARAGLRRGDRLVAIDGATASPARLAAVAARTSLGVQRRRGGPIETVVVAPRSIEPAEEWAQAQRAGTRVLVGPDGVRAGYVWLWSCAGDRPAEQLADALHGELAAADGLIVDLRDGWGGCDPGLVSQFDREVPVITSIDRAGKRAIYAAAWTGPLVVLVNRRTRSGKEVVAAALQRHRRAVVVGERTAGAVVAGQPFALPDGSLLYLAVADILVDGARLEGAGVVPDVVVADDVAQSEGRDPVLERARAVLSEEVRRARDPLRVDR